MTRERLTELFSGFASLRIAVAGDLFLDRWYEIDESLNEPSVETGLTAYQVVRKRAAAGAAGTVLRRRKKTEYLEAKSVPVGILPEIAFARSEKDLDAGDMLVMVSDGVTATGTEWLCDLIANYEDDDPQALSERIVERAVKDRADGHEDDVSAVVLLIE